LAATALLHPLLLLRHKVVLRSAVAIDIGSLLALGVCGIGGLLFAWLGVQVHEIHRGALVLAVITLETPLLPNRIGYE
jgi:hypothetical protein